MTNYSDIYDLFLVSIQDYKLDSLYSATPTAFESVLKGYLIKAIPRFDNCAKDLEDRDDTTQIFNITLTTSEKVILSNIMAYEWYQRQINDIRQMNLKMSNTDFKTYSESNNLKEKMERADRLREIFEQDITRYGLKNVDWDAWEEGNYD